MGDVDMPHASDVNLDSPKSYNPPARGWTKDLIRANHIDEVVKLLDKSPNKCLAVVILDSDFFDRGRGPGAIKATFVSNKIPDADKIDIYPPTPKEDVVDGRHLSMPWTNIAINCTDAFTSAVLASPVFHNVHDDLPISFYCLPVDPDMPWMFAVYTGLTGLAEPAEFKDAALTKLLADDVVIQMARDDHSNVPGEHSPAFVIRVALNLAQVSTCTVVRRAYNRRAIPTIAHRLLIPPISKNWDAIQRLQNHLMSAGFTIDVHMRGKATPWMGSDPQHPTLMSCNECHGIDHYISDCPIVNSPGYRAAHGIPDDDDDAGNSSVPTSLTVSPMAPPTNNWTTVSYRGAGRGQFRGGQGGGRFRGGGGFGRARGGYGGGFGRGGYGRGGYGRPYPF
ncbi:hypothetical protein B0H11DRAFT_85258 [Mycena galericulata]|nr:hypothetical protein B0H11DRAFT_85258 [Mycena galericulata]